MHTIFSEQTKSTITQLGSEVGHDRLDEPQVKDYKPDYIFVIQLHNGKFVVGQANNPAKRIASINSGYSKLVKGSLQVNCIVGIKEQNEDRTFAGVVKTFCDKYGQDAVIEV